LADYKLPSFNGAAALTICREKAPELPVIFVSGTIGEEAAVELLKNGATDYVVKDRLARLMPAVRRALNEVAERKARRKAQEDLRLLNQELEQRIIERTRELQKKNEMISEELRMARELQMALLPRYFPGLRDNSTRQDTVRFFSFFQPSGAVSGDFFDVIKVSDTQVGVLICDVMGHDVRAALVMAMMRALVNELGPAITEPGILLGKLNNGLCAILKQTSTAMFATAFYLLVDIARSKVSFSSAGHPSPFHLHRREGTVGNLHKGPQNGIALGLIENSLYKTFETPLTAEDCLILFTDGLFEVEAPNAEPFSQSRLMETVQANIKVPGSMLFSAIFGEIEKFAQTKNFQDDVCLVGLEVGPFYPSHGESPVSGPRIPEEAGLRS
jgi:serine phosphatase RsbU (regulator of sigma subunit)